MKTFLGVSKATSATARAGALMDAMVMMCSNTGLYPEAEIDKEAAILPQLARLSY